MKLVPIQSSCRVGVKGATGALALRVSLAEGVLPGGQFDFENPTGVGG